MELWIRFPVFVAASYAIFIGIIHFVLRRRESGGYLPQIFGIGVVVIVGGMVFAKFGQNTGLPW